MKDSLKTIAFTVERTIPAPPDAVFAAWLDPKVPGNPWNLADQLLLTPAVDGFFYWRVRGISHYGRFTQVDRPARLEHTWVSPNTHGHESTVTVTFNRKGDATLMTLIHSGLPDTDEGRSHQQGWTYFLDLFPNHFSPTPSA